MFGLELSFIWAGIIAGAVLIYVVLDGFDLGVGLLFPMTKDEGERNVMMNSVAPIWDGNETWLVLGFLRSFHWPMPLSCPRFTCRSS